MKNPPKEVKAIYNPEKPNAETAANLLRASVVKMKEALDRVKSADDNVRLKHWAGGWFNAKQWYYSAEMHIRHHFRQLERIKKHLAIDK